MVWDFFWPFPDNFWSLFLVTLPEPWLVEGNISCCFLLLMKSHFLATGHLPKFWSQNINCHKMPNVMKISWWNVKYHEMLMLMLDLWLQAETTGVTHFGAYNCPQDGHRVYITTVLTFCLLANVYIAPIFGTRMCPWYSLNGVPNTLPKQQGGYWKSWSLDIMSFNIIPVAKKYQDIHPRILSDSKKWYTDVCSGHISGTERDTTA